MNSRVVITIIAKDRPGLVELVAQHVAANGGNWESSRMSRLGGQFAGIVQVIVPKVSEQDLFHSLQQLEQSGIRVIVHPDEDEVQNSHSVTQRIRVMGQDHPGIIRDLTVVLFKHNANVEELHTELQNQPMSGEVLFVADIQVMLPPHCDREQLRADLEDVAADLMVDIEVI